MLVKVRRHHVDNIQRFGTLKASLHGDIIVLAWCFPFADRLPSYSGVVDARRRVPRRQARVAASASVPAAAAATSATAVVAAAAAAVLVVVASEAL